MATSNHVLMVSWYVTEEFLLARRIAVMERCVIEADDNLEEKPLPFLSSVVAVAIDGNRNSKYVVKWALEKFVPEGRVIFKLLHVRPRISGVPTPSKHCAFTFICSEDANM
jgi:hypothetical protein